MSLHANSRGILNSNPFITTILPLRPKPRFPVTADRPSSCRATNRRHFSTTMSRHRRVKGGKEYFIKMSGARRAMYQWLDGPGAVFRTGREGGTNYLNAYDKAGSRISDREAAQGKGSQVDEGAQHGAESKGSQTTFLESAEDRQPFPMNRYFKSDPILSEAEREEIYKRIVEEGHPIRKVSQQMGVDMMRVGAVVRLMTIEKRWQGEGKRLAIPYAKAIMSMVPQTPFDPKNPSDVKFHEPINNLPVHRATLPQLFHPTSESRQFTRTDAGRVFDSSLLPAENRIPHPDMVTSFKEQAGQTEEGFIPARERSRRQETRWTEEIKERQEKREQFERYQAKRTTVVETPRWDFKFENVAVDAATGANPIVSKRKRTMRAKELGDLARNKKGLGWRYGVPLEDRKKGQIKIPTRVE